MAVVPDADVRGSRGICRSCRELERAVAAGRARKAKDVLLELEMAGIGGPTFPERARELDRERSLQGDSQGDPDPERGTSAFPAFDLGDPRPAEPDARSQILERHVPAA